LRGRFEPPIINYLGLEWPQWAEETDVYSVGGVERAAKLVPRVIRGNATDYGMIHHGVQPNRINVN